MPPCRVPDSLLSCIDLMRGAPVITPLLALLVVVVLCLPGVAIASNWFIDPAAGTDSGVCGSTRTTPCKTIQYAVNASALTDTTYTTSTLIALLPGRYPCENGGRGVAVMNRTASPISIAAADGAGTVTIDCLSGTDAVTTPLRRAFMFVDVIGVNVTGLQFTGGDTAGDAPYLFIRQINVNSDSVITIRDCLFSGGRGGYLTSQPDVFPVSGSGAVLILFNTPSIDPNSFTAIAAPDVTRNSVSIINCRFVGNFGGSNHIRGSSGSGALNIVFLPLQLFSATSANRVSIQSCRFERNSGGDYNYCDGCTTYGYGSGGAGALNIAFLSVVGAVGNAVTVADTVFAGNLGGNDNVVNTIGAGALTLSYFSQGSDCAHNINTFTNTSFIGNRGGHNVMSLFGGKRTAQYGSSGALAIHYWMNTGGLLHSNRDTFTDCSFISNGGGFMSGRSVPGGGAGAIAIFAQSGNGFSHNKRTFIRCQFVNNTGTDRNDPALITSSRAGSGAVLIIDQNYGEAVNSSSHFSDCTFAGNSGSTGALAVIERSAEPILLAIHNSSFVGNTATCDLCVAGALAVYQLRLELSRVLIRSNRAGGFAGGMYIGASTSGSVTDSVFYENSAPTDSEMTCDSSLPIQFNRSVFELLVPTDRSAAATTATATSDSLALFSVAINVPPSVTFEAGTIVHCDGGYSVYHAAQRLYGCQRCGPTTYDIAGGVWIDDGDPNRGRRSYCLSCPFGAVCLGGAQLSVPAGYWTQPIQNTDSTTTASALVFAPLQRCTPGYCCVDASGSTKSGAAGMATCAYADICSDSHRSGQLCSDCQPGFTEPMIGSSHVCVADGNCDDGGWWIVVAFGCGTIWAVVLVWYIDHYDNYSIFPAAGEVLSILVIFYQLLQPIVAVTTGAGGRGRAGVSRTTGGGDPFTDTLSSVVNLRFTSAATSDVCLFPGMTAVAYHVLFIFIPMIVIVPLLLLFVIHRMTGGRNCIGRCRMYCCGVSSSSVTPHRPKAMYDDGAADSDQHRLSIRSRALAHVAFYTVTIVCHSIVSLLTCTTAVDDESREVLFAAPSSVKCYAGWQYLLFIVLAVILASPFALVLYTQWQASSQHGKEIPAITVGSPGANSEAVVWYRPNSKSDEFVWFESVRLMYRLLIITITGFTVAADSPVPTLIALLFVTIAYLCVVLMIQPFRSGPVTNIIHTLSVLCTVILIVMQLPVATASQTARPGGSSTDDSSEDGGLRSVFSALTALQLVARYLPIVTVAAITLFSYCCPSHVTASVVSALPKFSRWDEQITTTLAEDDDQQQRRQQSPTIELELPTANKYAFAMSDEGAKQPVALPAAALNYQPDEKSH